MAEKHKAVKQEVDVRNLTAKQKADVERKALSRHDKLLRKRKKQGSPVAKALRKEYQK